MDDHAPEVWLPGGISPKPGVAGPPWGPSERDSSASGAATTTSTTKAARAVRRW